MNDPHVISVHYKLIFGEGVNYRPPDTRSEYSLPEFNLSLDGERLTVWPQRHYATREEARAECEPLLKAWQLLIAVESGSVDVQIRYEQTNLVDRAPTPGKLECHIEESVHCIASMDAQVIRSFNRYPQAPDPALLVSADVDTLWQRYCGYKRGREPLPAMAYFVLTVVQALAGGQRRDAVQCFNVERIVLDNIGELSSTRGDKSTARKVDPGQPELPLTAEEVIWLEQAVQKLIIQVGRTRGGPPQTPLRLADLPQL